MRNFPPHVHLFDEVCYKKNSFELCFKMPIQIVFKKHIAGNQNRKKMVNFLQQDSSRE